MRQHMKAQRLTDKLNHEFGAAILSYLSNPDVTEIMLNPDGTLWIEDIEAGLIDTGEVIDPLNARQLIGSIADFAGTVVNEKKPTLETELPFLSYRFAGLIPPVVKTPCFVIRKSSKRLLCLEDYIEQQILTLPQAECIRGAIRRRDSILIAGGPGTGKTTFANALLQEMIQLGSPNQRFIFIEETSELKCPASNVVPIKTSEACDHDDLLRIALWLRPDKICVGECRGREMFTLLKAWNTGTQGGLTTIHANSAQSALIRVAEMASESNYAVSPQFICESIQLIIAMSFDGIQGRSIREIVSVKGFKEGDYVLETCL